MKIDIRDLSRGVCFQYPNGQTVFKVDNRGGTYHSVATGNVHTISPFFRSMVFVENRMSEVKPEAS